jgi:hypothetical protein
LISAGTPNGRSAINQPDEHDALQEERGVGAAREGATQPAGAIEASLREPEQPHRRADGQRTLDRGQGQRCPVQPEVEEDLPVDARGRHRRAQDSERHEAAQRGKAASAADPRGHGLEPAALRGDRPQAEHRHELRPLPQVGLADLVAAGRKDQAHENGGHGDRGGQRDERPT